MLARFALYRILRIVRFSLTPPFGDIGNPNTSFVVWGDSHAGALVRGVGEAAKLNGKSGYLAGFNGCVPLLNVMGAREPEPEKCNQSGEKILSVIKQGDIVFLVGRWTYYTHKSLINKEGPTWINDQQSHEISEEENYGVFERALERTIKAIQEKGAKPVVVNTVPEFSKSVPEAYYRFAQNIEVSRSLVEKNRQKTTVIMKRVLREVGGAYFDPLNAFCNKQKCYGASAEEIYFSDNDHINLKGALKLSPLMDRFFK